MNPTAALEILLGLPPTAFAVRGSGQGRNLSAIV
jgi:hypothetical protein